MGAARARDFAVGGVAIVVSYALLRGLWLVSDLVLVLFVAVIAAVGLRGLSRRLAAALPVNRKVALAGVVVVLLGLPVLLGAVLWPVAREQAVEAQEDLPELQERFDRWVGRVQRAVVPGDADGTSGSITDRTLTELGQSPSSQVLGWVSSFVGGVSRVVLALALILVVGFYVASSPATYRRGLVALVPPRHRDRVRDTLDEIGAALERWIVAQLGVMVVVGAATAAGLAVAGVPMALLLGVLAALLDFVPNFGPAIALVPALLVAASEGKIVAVLVVYGAVQVLEGWVLRPLVENRAVETPPALLLGAQVLLGGVLGFMGLLAAPALIVVATIVVRRLYVDATLGDPGADATDAEPSVSG